MATAHYASVRITSAMAARAAIAIRDAGITLNDKHYMGLLILHGKA